MECQCGRKLTFADRFKKRTICGHCYHRTRASLRTPCTPADGAAATNRHLAAMRLPAFKPGQTGDAWGASAGHSGRPTTVEEREAGVAHNEVERSDRSLRIARYCRLAADHEVITDA